MLIAIGFWLEIAKGSQDLLQCWRVFAIARFISGRENNVSHGVWQLHVSHTLPLGVGFCRGIFVDEIVAAVLPVAIFSFGLPCTSSIPLIAHATNSFTSWNCVLAIFAYMIVFASDHDEPFG